MRILVLCTVVALSAILFTSEDFVFAFVTGEEEIFRGDALLDWELNISDAVYIESYLFNGGPAPLCPRAADFDGGGTINQSDAIGILNYLFSSGSPPAAPQTFDVADCDL